MADLTKDTPALRGPGALAPTSAPYVYRFWRAGCKHGRRCGCPYVVTFEVLGGLRFQIDYPTLGAARWAIGRTSRGHWTSFEREGFMPRSYGVRGLAAGQLEVLNATGEPVRVVPPGRRALPAHVRRAVLAEQPACRRCGSTHRLHVDHIVPVALGGSDDRDNLQALCRTCNLRKGARLDAPLTG